MRLFRIPRLAQSRRVLEITSRSTQSKVCRQITHKGHFERSIFVRSVNIGTREFTQVFTSLRSLIRQITHVARFPRSNLVRTLLGASLCFVKQGP